MSSKRQPIKVSGLIKSGLLKPAPESVVDRMPSFDAETEAEATVSIDTNSPSKHTASAPLTLVPPEREHEPQTIQAENHTATDREGGTDEPPPPSDLTASINNVQMIPMASIRRGRYQNRIKLDEAYVADLADNIRTDELNSPIVVRQIDEWFELVAGENRYEAYKLNGHSHIPALVKMFDEKQAARATVFDNIFHKPTSDYELYRGFAMLLDMNAVPSQRQLAKDAGMSKTQVDRIMMFRKLPPEALSILDENPNLIGSAVASVLAGYVNDGLGELVVEAIRKIQSGELTQIRAGSWVAAKSSPKEKKSSRSVTHQQGKTFCTLERDGSHIKIKIASGVDTQSLENEIYELLIEKAKQMPKSME